ncbi:MAG: LysE family translocator [Flavobacteriaceae bacterium]|jgi:threonine/homoserine/homoserine lactone efflux protein|nr:LysE family translocator [Flavobacteriaceae bacterium]
MIESLISFSIATLFLALSPGPDNLYVIAQSLANGAKSGIATTIGLISGCIVHTTLLAFGVSAIIAASETLFYGLKVMGTCYLLFLAYSVFRSNAHVDLKDKASKKSYSQLFKQGVIMNLVNPKILIFFLAFFPGFLWDEYQHTIYQFYVLGILFMVISFIVFSGLAILAGYISATLNENKNVSVLLKWTQIVVFVGIAIFILIP